MSIWKAKHIYAKLLDVQKVARREKLIKLTNDITTVQDAYQEEAHAIAKDNGRGRKGNSIQKLNKENEGCVPEDRLKLPAFIKAHSSQLTSSYLRLMMADKNCLWENVNTLHMSCVKVTHVNPKALQKDVNTTFKTMQTEISIQARTGLERMYLAVWGDIKQFHEPKLFYTAKVESFIKDVLGMEPKHFALKVKSWVVGDFVAQKVSQCLRVFM
ncbi:hypothetical protein CY34DRAFT_17646 [Suillus luteus UH-Slu-Lm8-n1]|uniref:Uncharacterized protein n=1 Tax=Suillus luteus UH-Slu-Lm8-n1 TaxID=930992 RepID=A0A0D0ARG9_9AGAM|nr:hypothetical protein CY34DRAFT_17646 [Suillus luteus UH-Slu-Lm8-n1]